MTKLRLVSDFRDYYDHWFDLEGEPFERIATGGMDRPSMLAALAARGNKVPDHGRVTDLTRRIYGRFSASDLHPELATVIGQHTDLVVYTDERAHRGEGKVKLPLTDALARHPNAYASEWIMARGCPWKGHSDMAHTSWSLRELVIGNRHFLLEYWSDDDWRSNCGEGGVRVLLEGFPKPGAPLIDHPLYAVDYVLGADLYAVDFNIAPGLKGTGIEEILSAIDVVDLLKTALTK